MEKQRIAADLVRVLRAAGYDCELANPKLDSQQ